MPLQSKRVDGGSRKSKVERHCREWLEMLTKFSFCDLYYRLNVFPIPALRDEIGRFGAFSVRIANEIPLVVPRNHSSIPVEDKITSAVIFPNERK